MSQRKVIVTTINDKSFTLTGDVVDDIEKYLESGSNVPLGWITIKGQAAINFAHVVSIVFEE